jgi:two-component system cell cycle response regulator
MKMSTMQYAAIRVSLIMMAAEILIMLMLHAIPHTLSIYETAILDAVALVLVSTPPICIFVIKPFLETRDKTLAQVRNMSLTDPLTHLANRSLVVEHLDRVVAGCTRHNEYCAVLLINLDRFKLINEQYGYEAGDAVLVEVARRIHSTIRANDIVGRMGGDEFIVLLERLESDAGTTSDSIMHIANKLIAMINMPIAVNSKALHVSASIGIRLLGVEPANTDTAINEADNAMYRAKKAGGGRAVIFE